VSLWVWHSRYGSSGSPAGVRYSVIGILSIYIIEISVNRDIFLDFLYTQLLPLLMPFDGINHNSIFIMDNASIR